MLRFVIHFLNDSSVLNLSSSLNYIKRMDSTKTRSPTLKISYESQGESVQWFHKLFFLFVVRVGFMLTMAFRKLNFTILPTLRKYPPKYLVNILKLGMTNYSCILGQTFGKQRYELYNGSKINDIRFRFDILSDTLAFPGWLTKAQSSHAFTAKL